MLVMKRNGRSGGSKSPRIPRHTLHQPKRPRHYPLYTVTKGRDVRASPDHPFAPPSIVGGPNPPRPQLDPVQSHRLHQNTNSSLSPTPVAGIDCRYLREKRSKSDLVRRSRTRGPLRANIHAEQIRLRPLVGAHRDLSPVRENYEDKASHRGDGTATRSAVTGQHVKWKSLGDSVGGMDGDDLELVEICAVLFCICNFHGISRLSS